MPFEKRRSHLRPSKSSGLPRTYVAHSDDIYISEPVDIRDTERPGAVARVTKTGHCLRIYLNYRKLWPAAMVETWPITFWQFSARPGRRFAPEVSEQTCFRRGRTPRRDRKMNGKPCPVRSRVPFYSRDHLPANQPAENGGRYAIAPAHTCADTPPPQVSRAP